MQDRGNDEKAVSACEVPPVLQDLSFTEVGKFQRRSVAGVAALRVFVFVGG